MIASAEPLIDKKQTVKKIRYIIDKYYTDLRDFFLKKNGIITPLTRLSIIQFYDFTKAIPYRRDQKPIEIVIRPFYLLSNKGIGLDCKKKTTLCGSYCKCNNLKFRLIGSSQRPDKKIHHIYPEICLNGQWYSMDATYSHNDFGQDKPYTEKVLL